MGLNPGYLLKSFLLYLGYITLGAAHSCGGGVQTFDQQIFFDDDTFSNKSGEEFVHLVYSSNC